MGGGHRVEIPPLVVRVKLAKYLNVTSGGLRQLRLDV
jgi:hypothetical protein